MRPLRLVLFLVVLVALQPIAARSFLSHHTDAAHHQDNHNGAVHGDVAALPQHDSHEDHGLPVSHDVTVADDHDLHARNDMHAFAVRHFGPADEHPETLSGSVHWAGEWELRWMDVTHDHQNVRLYHATNKQNHDLRYVAAWDEQHGHYGAWEQVH